MKADNIPLLAFLLFISVLMTVANFTHGSSAGNVNRAIKSGWIEVDGVTYRCIPQPGVRLIDGKPAKLLDDVPAATENTSAAAAENEP